MNHFEAAPSSPRIKALMDIEKTATEGSYELVMLEETEENLRFQILSSEQEGLGQDESEAFLQSLFAHSTVLSEENTRIVVHPNYAVNIEVSL
ncbi:MAG TPA: hypothetical protein VGE31_03010 [Candidatus Paceibacterota bacterium]